MPATFFACYLLTPALAPRRLRCTYVGFTVSPARRLRQHNGELTHGAKSTTKYRPWEMVGVVHGFPTKFYALQFEWAWQHPYASRLTRGRLAALKGAKGVGAPRSVKRKLHELHEMLHVLPWSQFPLTVSYTSAANHEMARALGEYYRWPAHMTCETRSLSEFTRVGRSSSGVDAQASDDEEGADDLEADPDACFICEQAFNAPPERSNGSTATARAATTLQCYHHDCPMRCHTLCLADHFVATADASEADSTTIRPESGHCPCCARELLWPLLTQQTCGQVLGVRGIASTSSEAPKRKRRRKNAERDDARITTSSELIDAQQRVEIPLPETNRGVEVVIDDGSSLAQEYDDSGWFEDDDVDMQSDGDRDREEEPSPVWHIDSEAAALPGSDTRTSYHADTVNASGGKPGRARSEDRTRTDSLESAAPVIVDLTLDEDDDREL